MDKKQRKEKIVGLKKDGIDYNEIGLMLTTECSTQVVWFCFLFQYLNSGYFQLTRRSAFMGLFFSSKHWKEVQRDDLQNRFHIWLFGLQAVALSFMWHQSTHCSHRTQRKITILMQNNINSNIFALCISFFSLLGHVFYNKTIWILKMGQRH